MKSLELSNKRVRIREAIPEDIQKDSRIHTFKNFLELGKDINNNTID